MSDLKITQLPEITSPSNSDVLPIVSSGVTSKIQKSNLVGSNIPLSYLDTTVTLGNSDTKVPSQNAVKTYVDNNGGGGSLLFMQVFT